MKRDKRDKVMSFLVRERASWCCERCGKEYPEGHRQGLDCSHLFGRRHRSTRWTRDNCFAHCRGCHQYLGSNPVVFTEWAKEKLGETRLEWLTYRHNQVVKYTRDDLERIYKHLKSEYGKMLAKRANGETGYLEWSDYD